MPCEIKQSDEVDRYCEECNTCFSGAPEECPECGRKAPAGGFSPLHLAPHPYLGKLVDGR